jgi:hypothetical protein
MYHIDFWRSLFGVLAPVLWVGIQPSIININVHYAGAKSCPEAWDTHFFCVIETSHHSYDLYLYRLYNFSSDGDFLHGLNKLRKVGRVQPVAHRTAVTVKGSNRCCSIKLIPR